MRAVAAEFVGTAFLLVAVVGSGIMGERLAGGNVAIALLALYAWSRHVRHGLPQAFSEVIASFGLLAVIWGCSRRRSTAVPFAVGAYITGAYWFTASTSFANPAVTLARSLTDTFAGIRPVDVPGFIAAQIIGASAATWLFRWLVPPLPAVANHVVTPHTTGQEGRQWRS